jgi:hypothetical protein
MKFSSEQPMRNSSLISKALNPWEIEHEILLLQNAMAPMKTSTQQPEFSIGTGFLL